MAPAIEFKGIEFSYGKTKILNSVSFAIASEETLCVVGESGCGKTTALGLINGLLTPSSGDVLIHGKPLSSSNGVLWRRSLGYCIQGNLLFPHMTLAENMSLVAQKDGWGKENLSERLKELCQWLQLPGSEEFLQKKPRQISGGQRQRVALARALFLSPKILLMDEPFGALDPITRSELQDEFLTLCKGLKLTVVLVTHDLTEAFKMGHQVMLLRSGNVEQLSTPKEFLTQPKSPYVKTFTESQLKTFMSLQGLLRDQ